MQAVSEIKVINRKIRSTRLLSALLAGLIVLSAILIGSNPLQLSIITIFLFAGVHNFMEFRYFAARMPVRWGRSKLFYTVGIIGVLILTFAYLSIFFAFHNWLWSFETGTFLLGFWNTGLILWVAWLVYLRGRQRPKSDWSWAFAAGFALSAIAWLVPNYFALSLVYLHPFIALWFFDRQLRRSKPDWQKSYRLFLALIPVILALMYLLFANAPHLPEQNALEARIAQHAGSGILPMLSSHFLVAAHVFLETIHYSIWILFIPLIDRRAIPWRLSEIPLIINKNGYPKLILTALFISFILVLVLWFGFSFDYATTRDVYFAFAIAHVLAEFPFLIKML
jgi:hypothetical protein